MVPFTKLVSYKKDEEILKKPIEEAPNPRERQRLTRLKCEHSLGLCCSLSGWERHGDATTKFSGCYRHEVGSVYANH